MSSWGTKRRNNIILIFVAIIIFFAIPTIIKIIYSEPSCFDGKRNGSEEEIDCGGKCRLVCTNQAIEPIVQWSRFFEVVPGIYNVAAYVENQNSDAGINRLEYSFKLYDINGVLLDSREGVTRIKPKQKIPIIEANLNTGELRAARVSFELQEDIIWQKEEPQEKLIDINDERLFELDGLPRISAEVYNKSYQPIKDINFIVIVYDLNDNAVASSRTYIDHLDRGQSRDIIFTWLQKFPEGSTRFEIIPFYDVY